MGSDKKIELMVSGMTCEGCVAAVTRIVKKADPQASVTIDLASGKVDITSLIEQPALSAAIEKAGYDTATR